jgi:hypothetical protein
MQYSDMAKSLKIIVEKPKKRIPVPKKPPKIEEDKKAYNRKKEKNKLQKSLSITISKIK